VADGAADVAVAVRLLPVARRAGYVAGLTASMLLR
jgi:hypothetical protein